MAKTTKQAEKKPAVLSKLEKFLPWILIVCGVIGIFASAAITVEKMNLLAHPGSTFICDLNPIISCGSVMASKQANTFGFTNPIVGLVGFPVLVSAGVAMLAGARFKHWFWLGMEIGLGLGVVFAYWLLFESIYDIGALCPWCLTVDVAITTVFWYLSLYIIDKGWIRLPAKLQKASNFARRHHLDILIVWFLVYIALILKHFWYYFGRNF